MARRLALLIGNSQFEDKEHFPPLRTPANDVTDMAAMLARHGDFEIVGTLVDAAEPAIRRAIADLYSQAERGDLTLLYYSGHGQKGTDGSLYLAAKDTDFRHLRATGVHVSYIQETMADSRSRHHVVILDCCFSGAFAYGMKRGAAEPLLLEKLKGEATAILASSGTIQYSFEEKGRNSLFTSALLAGIETGQADENGDGLLTVDELFAYADRQVREQRRDQTPMLAQRKREIENVVLVRNPLGKARAVSLPLTITPSPPPAAQIKGAVPAAASLQPDLPGWLWGVGGVLVTLALVFLLLWLSERGDPTETPAATLPAVAQVTETLTATPTGTGHALTPDTLPAATTPASTLTATSTRTPTRTPLPTPEPTPANTPLPETGSTQPIPPIIPTRTKTPTATETATLNPSPTNTPILSTPTIEVAPNTLQITSLKPAPGDPALRSGAIIANFRYNIAVEKADIYFHSITYSDANCTAQIDSMSFQYKRDVPSGIDSGWLPVYLSWGGQDQTNQAPYIGVWLSMSFIGGQYDTDLICYEIR